MSITAVLLSVLSAALFVPVAAGAAGLPNGEYHCSLSSQMLMGSVWIEGNTYVGPLFERAGPTHRYEVTASRTINWGAPLEGMEGDGNRVVATVLKDAGGGRVGFDIQIQLPSGNFATVGCEPES